MQTKIDLQMLEPKKKVGLIVVMQKENAEKFNQMYNWIIQGSMILQPRENGNPSCFSVRSTGDK